MDAGAISQTGDAMRNSVILAGLQLVIAIALLISNGARPNQIQSPSFTKPDIQLCHALNSPVSLFIFAVTLAARHFEPKLPHIVEFSIEPVLYLTLVGVLWYSVGTEIQARGQSALTSKTRIRAILDLLAVGYGAVLLALCILIASGPSTIPFREGRAIGYLLWGVALVGFYGHDLWISRRSRLI